MSSNDSDDDRGKCLNLFLFQDHEVMITAFVVDAIALTIMLITLCVWYSARKINSAVRSVLPWYTYGLLLFLYIM
jgi:hypothetical protein